MLGDVQEGVHVGLVEGTWRQHRLRKVHGEKSATGQGSACGVVLSSFFPSLSNIR